MASQEALLLSLIHSHKGKDALLPYYHRLLASNVACSLVNDHVTLSISITKLLLKTKSTAASRAFSVLFTKLCALDVVKNKFAILYFLKLLSDQNSTGSSSASLSLPYVPVDPPTAIPSLSKTTTTTTTTTTTNSQSQNLPKHMLYYKNTTPEHLLLKDLIYCFQGLNGTYIKYNQATSSFEIQNCVITPPTKLLLLKLADLTILYKTLQTYLTTCPNSGLVIQSFNAALDKELNEYFKLLAILESLISSSSETLPQISLRRVYVWTLQPYQRFRLLAALTLSSATSVSILSSIFALTSHGDPEIREYCTELLQTTLQPYYTILSKWINSGELQDPYGEFFVQKTTDTIKSDWRSTYKMVQEKIPTIILKSTAKKVYMTGKSINFLRYNCNHQIVPEGTSDENPIPVISDFQSLSTIVSEKYTKTSELLISVLYTKFNLDLHLETLKGIFLFGYGDFQTLLIDLFDPILSVPSVSIYKHNLTSVLSSALRLLTLPDEIQRRIDIKISPQSGGGGTETGWDLIFLDYFVDEQPLKTIFGEKVVLQYQRLWKFLNKLKRAERKLGGLKGREGTRFGRKVLGGMKNEEFFYCLVNAEMLSFTRLVLQYFYFEVIEDSWAIFMQKTGGGSGGAGHGKKVSLDFEELIAEHVSFLNRIVERVQLSDTDSLFVRVESVLEWILKFKDVEDKLAKSVEVGGGKEEIRRLNSLVFEYAKEFKADLQSLMKLLASHSKDHIKDLATRLNFNSCYFV